MHWIDETTAELIKNHPNVEEFVCAAGISPSGPIHMGNFREFLTSYFITEGLKRAGKKTRFIMSFDSFDRLRKVPADVKKVVGDTYDKYVGMPDIDIPDPWGCHKNYAEHFQSEFQDAVKKFGIECEYLYQGEIYRTGRYADDIIQAIKKRKEIYDILYEYKKQEATEEGRNSYVPVSIYCSKCGKDFTTVTNVSDDCEHLTYTCAACGHTETIDIKTFRNIKLVWKVDWPMRWAKEKVIFEPGGKDHGTEGSSYTVGKLIAPAVYNYQAPDFIMYEMIGKKGGDGKMSSSKGGVTIPADLIKVCPPEMVLWLYSRVPARQSWSFCFDEEILRQYHEFDRMVAAAQKPECPQNIKDIVYYSLIGKKDKSPSTVSAQLLFSLGSIVNFDKELTFDLYKKVEPQVSKKDLEDRLSKIKFWAETYSPESITKLLPQKNIEYFNTLSDKEKQSVKETYKKLLENEYELDELQQLLYAIPKDETKTDKENKETQQRYFEIIYMLLIGKTSGPRLYLFLGALDKNMYLPLLNF